MENIKIVPISLLRSFNGEYGKNYFRQRYDKVQELKESIATYGLIEPVIVRCDPKDNSKYEIISGHTRVKALNELGIKEVTVIIKDSSNSEAVALVGESNRYREGLTIIEKAYMHKYNTEFIEKSSNGTAVPFDEISERQKRNYIRLTYLVPELQDMVNNKSISVKVGVELSYLREELQKDIAFTIAGTNKHITTEIVELIKIKDKEKKAYGEKWTYDEIDRILNMQDNKKKKIKISISKEIIDNLPPEYSDIKQIELLVEKILINLNKNY